MTSRDFCYWLQGYLEVSKDKSLDAETTEMVKRHLSLVFRHEIDPSFGKSLPDLLALHAKKKKRKPAIKYCAPLHERPITC